jgi:hypothetical protein
MKRCWDSDPNKRPTADELVEILSYWYDYYPKPGLHDRIPVPSKLKKFQTIHIIFTFIASSLLYLILYI